MSTSAIGYLQVLCVEYRVCRFWVFSVTHEAHIQLFDSCDKKFQIIYLRQEINTYFFVNIFKFEIQICSYTKTLMVEQVPKIPVFQPLNSAAYTLSSTCRCDWCEAKLFATVSLYVDLAQPEYDEYSHIVTYRGCAPPILSSRGVSIDCVYSIVHHQEAKATPQVRCAAPLLATTHHGPLHAHAICRHRYTHTYIYVIIYSTVNTREPVCHIFGG